MNPQSQDNKTLSRREHGILSPKGITMTEKLANTSDIPIGGSLVTSMMFKLNDKHEFPSDYRLHKAIVEIMRKGLSTLSRS